MDRNQNQKKYLFDDRIADKKARSALFWLRIHGVTRAAVYLMVFHRCGLKEPTLRQACALDEATVPFMSTCVL